MANLSMPSVAARLKKMLTEDGLLLMPCCFDALSARLIEMTGFKLTFMSGFAVSATRLALPDTGLISYGEMVDQGRNITAAVSIPVLADGDTGYGNAINVKRTVAGYAATGFACVMIEDQVSPKRCGHITGKQVVGRSEALTRIRAAVDAREEGADILIMARTDARTTLGIADALWRCQAFADLGADIIFLEAPESREEMRRFCRQVRGAKMANMVEGGRTPLLPAAELADMGYKIAAYPLTMLGVAVKAMQDALCRLRDDGRLENSMDLNRLKDIVGFERYAEEERRYSSGRHRDD
jgi:2-methylisocitrate lyase-like PEP mutase family enzyme